MLDNYKFKTKRGDITKYALICGYIQEKETKGIKTTMWHEGGPCIHIRTHDFKNHNRLAWDITEETNIVSARKIFKRHIREYHKK